MALECALKQGNSVSPIIHLAAAPESAANGTVYRAIGCGVGDIGDTNAMCRIIFVLNVVLECRGRTRQGAIDVGFCILVGGIAQDIANLAADEFLQR